MLTWWGIMLDVVDFQRVPIFAGRNSEYLNFSFAHSSLSLFEWSRKII